MLSHLQIGIGNLFSLVCEMLQLSCTSFFQLMGCNTIRWHIRSFQELLKVCISPPREIYGNLLDKDLLVVFLTTILYLAWRKRNEFVYSIRKSFNVVVNKFNRVVVDFLEILSAINFVQPGLASKAWTSSLLGCTKLYGWLFYQGQSFHGFSDQRCAWQNASF